MSRAYKIALKDCETRDLKAGDEIGTSLEILEILPPEEMGALLREELKNRGFVEQEDGTMVRESKDGLTEIVDPCSGKITITSSSEQTVKQEAERQGTGYDDAGPRKGELTKKIKEQLKDDLNKKFEQQQEKLQADTSERLEKHLSKIQPEINEIVNKVTREALKQKAQQLGNVKEIHEEANGDMTIRVEV